MTSYRDTLYHDGVPNMQWGVRRYRNYDGTLTEAGRQRYGVGPPRKKSESSKKKPSRAERKAQKEIKRKASAKAAERKAKEAIEEARRASEEAKKEREALEKARADRDKNSATREGNEQMRLNNELLKMKVEQLDLERKYNALVNPAKQKTLLSKRVADLAENSRKVIAFGKDLADLTSAIKKAKGGEEKSYIDKLTEEEKIDRLNYLIEDRKRKRATWADEDRKKAEGSKQSRQDANNQYKETADKSKPESAPNESAWKAPTSYPNYSIPALPPHTEAKSPRKRKRKG